MWLFYCARRPAGGWKGFCFQLNGEWVILSLANRQPSHTHSFTLSLTHIYSISDSFIFSPLSLTHSFTHTDTDRIIQLLVPSWKTMRALLGYDIYFNSKAFVNEFVDMHTILSLKDFRFQQVIFSQCKSVHIGMCSHEALYIHFAWGLMHHKELLLCYWIISHRGWLADSLVHHQLLQAPTTTTLSPRKVWYQTGRKAEIEPRKVGASWL